MLVPLLKMKQSVSLAIEERFNQLRDEIGSILSTKGCYDIDHLTPYHKKGHIGQKLSMMHILDWLYPANNSMLAFPKCSTNCSNSKLISPSPTPAAEPKNIISASTKADLFGGKKVPNSRLFESKKIRNMVKQICIVKRKYQIQNCLKLRKLGNMVKLESHKLLE